MSDFGHDLAPDSYLWRELDNMYAASHDPTVESSLDIARDIDQALRVGEISLSDAISFARQLDSEEWFDLVSQDMVLTGHINQYPGDLHTGEDGFLYDVEGHPGLPVSNFFVEDMHLKSAGFIVEKTDGGLRLRLLGVRGETTEEGSMVIAAYGIPLDADVAFPSILSDERAMALLQEYAADILDDIDERLFSPDAAGSADLIKQMRGLDLSGLSELPEQTSAHVVESLECYINRQINPDTQVPYIISHDGWIVFDEADVSYMASSSGVLVLASGVGIVKIVVDEGALEWAVTLDGQLITENDKDQKCIRFALNGVRELASIREEYFRGS